MSTTTTFKCDLCRAEQSTHNQFWTVSVLVEHYGSVRSPYGQPQNSVEACRVCVDRLGLLSKLPPKDAAVSVPGPTFEASLLELLARIGIEPTP